MPALRNGEIRVGIVGGGFGQQVLVPAFRLHAGARVQAIATASAEKATALARRLEIPQACGDWQELVAHPDIDAVAIAVPPTLQAPIAVAALENGKSVFCEKPLADALAPALALARAAERAGLANVIDFELPETAAWQGARALLNSDTTGELRHFQVSWNVETRAVRTQARGWKNRASAGGGALLSFLPHVFYGLEWLAGPVQALACRLQSPAEADAADRFVAAVVELASGAVGSLTVSTDAYLGGGQRWEFHGSEGTLVLANAGDNAVAGYELWRATRAGGAFEPVALDSAPPHPVDGRIAAVAPLAGRFLDWSRDRARACRPDFRDGLRVQRLLEAALESHRTGRRIAC